MQILTRIPLCVGCKQLRPIRVGEKVRAGDGACGSPIGQYRSQSREYYRDFWRSWPYTNLGQQGVCVWLWMEQQRAIGALR